MFVGVLQIDLAIEGSNSLKDKRRVISALLAKLRNGFRVSASEVGDNDLWRSACIGIAAVSNSAIELESLLGSIEEVIASNPEVELRNVWREIEPR